MTEYSEQIQKTYRVMETEELLGRIKAGTLTEEAHALALGEIKARGISTAELSINPSPPLANDKHPEHEALWELTRCMNQITTNQTLDIHGTINSYTKTGWKVGGAVAFLGLGIHLWDGGGVAFPVMSFIIGVLLPANKHTYLDFTGRQIVTVKHYAWFETSKLCYPLTDFCNIVVRYLCHTDSEGGDIYTGSVGLKPVDGRSVLWVKGFPTTEGKIPRTAYKFARKLQEMTGLPGAPEGEFKSETQ